MFTNLKAPTSVWIGRVMSGLFVFFMLFASISPKFFFPEMGKAYVAMDALGWPHKFLIMIAVIELVCTILYVIPRTSILGAVLMTGLLGGAIASQVRVENPLFSHELFGIYLGLFMWGGLWLRDEKLRALFPFRRD